MAGWKGVVGRVSGRRSLKIASADLVSAIGVRNSSSCIIHRCRDSLSGIRLLGKRGCTIWKIITRTSKAGRPGLIRLSRVYCRGIHILRMQTMSEENTGGGYLITPPTEITQKLLI